MHKSIEVIPAPGPDYALKIRHTISSGWEQWYFLTNDNHWDSPECYLKLLRRHAKEAKEKDALWIDGGDFRDVISSRDDPRGSKGTVRPEHVGVNYLDRIVAGETEEFRPYADQFVYLGTGNHEQAVTIRKETDLTNRLIENLNRLRSKGLSPIHRAGYTGWIRFMFEQASKCGRFSMSMKVEHGTGGNSPVTKGVIQTARRQARTEGCTFFMSGHIHEQWEMPIIVERLNESTSRVEQRKVQHIQVASYKQDFRTDGVGTWAMMKMGTPKAIGGTWLRFYCPNGKDVEWEIRPAWVDYANLADYLPKTTVTCEAVA